MSEWKEYTLGELTTDGKGTYGIAASAVDYCAELPTYLRITDINDDGTIDFNGLKSVDDPNSSKYVLQENDIVFARTGASTGRSYFYDRRDGKFVYAGFLIKFSLDPKKVNPRILKYYTHSKVYYNWVHSFENGATRGNINAKTFADMKLLLPPRNVQDSIASILSSLDDKIAINRRICENLEAQAQALFKHWFIDFAPFKNGKFVESELGMIPEGWRVGRYSDIIQETISGDWGKENAEGNYTHKVACIRGCDFQDVKMGLRGKTPERYILEKNYQAKHFEDKDVLVEISGGTATVSTGRVCPVSQLLIDKYNGDIVCTNFCRLVRPCKGFSSYLYYSWKYKYDHKVMFGYENGTSGIKNFSIKDFSTREPLVLPDLSALKDFERIIEHIHAQIQNYGSESSRLSALRDTLLPKLMSGEIKV